MTKTNKPRVAIVDYGIGNLHSVKKACEIVGLEAFITSNKSDVLNSDALILPGVGAFKNAMENLNSFGLAETIINYAKLDKYILLNPRPLRLARVFVINF
jgi:glutamine amidotransferase